MFPIYEISAAPHFPHALKSAQSTVPRPEPAISVLMVAANDARHVEVMESDGEIYVAITANR
jgi:hypothetical protein